MVNVLLRCKALERPSVKLACASHSSTENGWLSLDALGRPHGPFPIALPNSRHPFHVLQEQTAGRAEKYGNKRQDSLQITRRAPPCTKLGANQEQEMREENARPRR